MIAQENIKAQSFLLQNMTAEKLLTNEKIKKLTNSLQNMAGTKDEQFKEYENQMKKMKDEMQAKDALILENVYFIFLYLYLIQFYVENVLE